MPNPKRAARHSSRAWSSSGGCPERSAELSGLMCMAIAGGALVPLAMGKLVDQGFGGAAYGVPAACFAYLVVLAFQRIA